MTSGSPRSDDFNELMTELREWNDGAGIPPDAWINNVGNLELAIGYSLIFFTCSTMS